MQIWNFLRFLLHQGHIAHTAQALWCENAPCGAAEAQKTYPGRFRRALVHFQMGAGLLYKTIKRSSPIRSNLVKFCLFWRPRKACSWVGHLAHASILQWTVTSPRSQCLLSLMMLALNKRSSGETGMRIMALTFLSYWMTKYLHQLIENTYKSCNYSSTL